MAGDNALVDASDQHGEACMAIENPTVMTIEEVESPIAVGALQALLRSLAFVEEPTSIEHTGHTAASPTPPAQVTAPH